MRESKFEEAEQSQEFAKSQFFSSDRTSQTKGKNSFSCVSLLVSTEEETPRELPLGTDFDGI